MTTAGVKGLTAYTRHIDGIFALEVHKEVNGRARRSVRSTNENNLTRKAELLHRSSSCLELTAA